MGVLSSVAGADPLIDQSVESQNAWMEEGKAQRAYIEATNSVPPDKALIAKCFQAWQEARARSALLRSQVRTTSGESPTPVGPERAAETGVEKAEAEESAARMAYFAAKQDHPDDKALIMRCFKAMKEAEFRRLQVGRSDQSPEQRLESLLRGGSGKNGPEIRHLPSFVGGPTTEAEIARDLAYREQAAKARRDEIAETRARDIEQNASHVEAAQARLGKPVLVPTPEIPGASVPHIGPPMLPDEYDSFMRVADDEWATSPSVATTFLAEPFQSDWIPVLAKLPSSQNPYAREYLREFSQAIADNVEAERARKQRLDRYEVRKSVAESFGKELLHDAEDTLAKWEQVGLMGTLRGVSEEQRLPTLHRMARLEQFRRLPPVLGGIYPATPKMEKMIQVGVGTNQVVFTNISPQDLHQVTLHVMLVRPPHPSVRCVMFVDSLGKGQSVHTAPFMENALHDQNTFRLMEHRPETPEQIPQAEFNWYEETHGIIESQIHVWSAEGHCAPQVTRYPEQVLKAGQFLMDAATRVAAKADPNEKIKVNYLRPLGNMLGMKSKIVADVVWAREAARFALTFVPADSAVAAEAKAMSSRYANVNGEEDLPRKVLEAYGGRFVGEYSLIDREDHQASTEEGVKINWAALRARHGKGRAAMDVVGLMPTNELKIVFYDAAAPQIKRGFLGKVTADAEGRTHIECLPVEKNPSLPDPSATTLTPCISRLYLHTTPDGLAGYVGASEIGFSVTCRRQAPQK